MEDGSQTICVFCIEDFKSSDKTVDFVGCNHKVHSHCFFDYVNYRLSMNQPVSCPVCRKVIINIHCSPLPYNPTPAMSPPPPILQNMTDNENNGDMSILRQKRAQAFSMFMGIVVVVYFFYTITEISENGKV